MAFALSVYQEYWNLLLSIQFLIFALIYAAKHLVGLQRLHRKMLSKCKRKHGMHTQDVKQVCNALVLNFYFIFCFLFASVHLYKLINIYLSSVVYKWVSYFSVIKVTILFSSAIFSGYFWQMFWFPVIVCAHRSYILAVPLLCQVLSHNWDCP